MDEWYWEPHFAEDEFRCKATGEVDMDEDFMCMMFTLRELYEKPIIITSGYRSVNHPVEKDKDKPGEHTYGLAADIYVPPEDVMEVIHLAYLVGFRRLGVRQDKEARFIHLGLGSEEEGFPQVTWTY